MVQEITNQVFEGAVPTVVLRLFANNWQEADGVLLVPSHRILRAAGTFDRWQLLDNLQLVVMEGGRKVEAIMLPNGVLTRFEGYPESPRTFNPGASYLTYLAGLPPVYGHAHFIPYPSIEIGGNYEAFRDTVIEGGRALQLRLEAA